MWSFSLILNNMNEVLQWIVIAGDTVKFKK